MPRASSADVLGLWTTTNPPSGGAWIAIAFGNRHSANLLAQAALNHNGIGPSRTSKGRASALPQRCNSASTCKMDFNPRLSLPEGSIFRIAAGIGQLTPVNSSSARGVAYWGQRGARKSCGIRPFCSMSANQFRQITAGQTGIKLARRGSKSQILGGLLSRLTSQDTRPLASQSDILPDRAMGSGSSSRASSKVAVRRGSAKTEGDSRSGVARLAR
ncbi:hypothetical protein HRbin36_01983 [bacterium HR36]|nr:hypothetical protein HRbin36_01983 [bacterium HR36]